MPAVEEASAGRIGGITEAKRVADYARTKGVTFVNHTFTSHLTLVSSLQPMAGGEEGALCEYPTELKPMAYETTREHIEPDADGLLRLPDFFARVHAAGLNDTLATPLLLIGLMAYGWLIYIPQQVVYGPAYPIAHTPTEVSLRYRDVTVTEPVDGISLQGWYIPVGNARAAVLFLHGGGERGDGREELNYVLWHGPLREAWIQGRELPFIMIGPHLPVLGQHDQVQLRAGRPLPVRLPTGPVPPRPEERPARTMARAHERRRRSSSRHRKVSYSSAVAAPGRS